MISMKRSKKEVKESMAVESYEEDKYPWGLRIRLGEEEISKLGMDMLPSVGTELILNAKVKVTSVSENETEENGKDRDVGLQITDMELSRKKETTSEEAVAKIYG